MVADADAAGLARLRTDAEVETLQLDVTDRAAVRAAVASLDPAPELLVTCAGGAERLGWSEIDEEALEACFRLNAAALLWCAQAVAARLSGSGRPGAFVHVGSSLFRGPAPGLAHFAAAKAAATTLVRCLAAELGELGIRVNAVIPGPIETPATMRVWQRRPDIEKAVIDATILRRVGRPDEVAEAVCFLLSDRSGYTTGSLLRLDGGLGLHP